MFTRGCYIGPNESDRGKTALIKQFDDRVEVQFDEFDHPKSHYWHPYPKEDWELLTDGGCNVES